MPTQKEPVTPSVTEKTNVELVAVRFDSDEGQWAVIDQSSNPARHFTHGVLTDVQFSTKRVAVGMIGCGYSENIGIATGVLAAENDYGDDAVGFHNLQFNGHEFVDAHGKPIKSASVVRLLQGRRALYK